MVITLTNLAEYSRLHNGNEPLLRQMCGQSEPGTLAFPQPPPSASLLCIFLLCLYVCPRHAHSLDTEPCGRVTLSCQLWSTLCWSGAAAQYSNQGQGSLTAGCSGTHLNANRHEKWINRYIFPSSLKNDFLQHHEASFDKNLTWLLCFCPWVNLLSL